MDEIAQRAEIGRTTFFRYFGDKQEVVFSTEDDFLRALTAAMHDAPTEPLQDLAQALATSRRLLLAICTEAARNPDHYAVYHRLVEQHPELEDRHTRKTRHYADLLEKHLIDHGTPCGHRRPRRPVDRRLLPGGVAPRPPRRDGGAPRGE